MRKHHQSVIVTASAIPIAFLTVCSPTFAGEGASKSATVQNGPKQHATRYIRKAEFEILGAGCVSCVRQIERMLKTMNGVESAQVTGFVPTKAVVVYDMDKTNLKVFIDQLKKSGYGVKNQQDSFYHVGDQPQAAGNKGAFDLLKMQELKAPVQH